MQGLSRASRRGVPARRCREGGSAALPLEPHGPGAMAGHGYRGFWAAHHKKTSPAQFGTARGTLCKQGVPH